MARARLRMGISRRQPKHVLVLTARHRQQRIQWANEHRNWILEEWKDLAWFVESDFLHHINGCARIRQFPMQILAY